MEDHSRAFIQDLCQERNLYGDLFIWGESGADEKIEGADGCAIE